MIKRYGIIGTALLGIASSIYFAYNHWNLQANLVSIKKEAKKEGTTKIFAVGDSLTAGYGVSTQETYPSQLEEKLQASGYNVKVINKGKNGETTERLLERIDAIKRENPDMVLITIGGNDALRKVPTKTIQENLIKIVESLKEAVPNDKIFLMQIQMPPIHGFAYMLGFNSLYPRVAKKEKINLLSFVVPDVFLERSLMQGDYIHPNKEGYKRIVEKYIFERIEKQM